MGGSGEVAATALAPICLRLLGSASLDQLAEPGLAKGQSAVPGARSRSPVGTAALSPVPALRRRYNQAPCPGAAPRCLAPSSPSRGEPRAAPAGDVTLPPPRQHSAHTPSPAAGIPSCPFPWGRLVWQPRSLKRTWRAESLPNLTRALSRARKRERRALASTASRSVSGAGRKTSSFFSFSCPARSPQSRKCFFLIIILR